MIPAPRPVRLLWLLLVLVLRAEASLESVRRAQAELGPGVWSRAITVRNEARHSPYPRTVHALVFELAGLLWFYTDVDGTQSFSLHAGELDREKADFLPLLHDIEPGFTHWAPADTTGGPAPRGGPLPNGCFIESVVALRERLAHGGRTESPRLLLYYVATDSGQKGHTVLAYETGGVTEILDASRPARRFVFPPAVGRDPLALARALDGADVRKARTIPLGAAAVGDIAQAGERARPEALAVARRRSPRDETRPVPQ